MALEVETKELFNYQKAIVGGGGRFNAICAGRRGGKTAMIEDLAFGAGGCLDIDVRKKGGGYEGRKIGIFSPSYRTMGEIWRELYHTGRNVLTHSNKGERMEVYGGGVLEFWSMDNIDVSRGRKYHRVIVDEAAGASNLRYAFNEVIRAMLLDYSGDFWAFSTPKGVGDMFHEMFNYASNKVPGWKSYRFPTSLNPMISKDELESIRLTMPSSVFRREYLAEFVSENEDNWLYNVDLSKHTTLELGGGMKKVGYLPEYPIYIFSDFNNDPVEGTIWQMGGTMGQPGSFVHCIDSFSKKAKVADLGVELRTRYPGANIFIGGDATGTNEDLGRYQTLYQIFASSMGVPMRNVLLNKKNLYHSDSRLLCNVLFQNLPRLVIESPELLRQIDLAVVDEKRGANQLKKDRGTFKLDMFDSMRYFFQTMFLKFARQAYFKGAASGLLRTKE